MLARLLLAATIATTIGCSENPEPNGKKLPDGVTLIERVEDNNNPLLIPYSKYQLDNGLTVILHEDKSDPIVDVDITYHVGSAREQQGYSGFAHFFEHMMFQGSENVADEEHFAIITETGGTLNGTTNSDRTNYFNTAPSNQLGTLLWLEADRMGFLLDAIDEKKFENQRETVKNERGQRVDNRPYGRIWETIGSTLYPAGHPYSWPVIGHLADLDRAQLPAVKNFFLRWYGPNNATLTVGGDIDETQALKEIITYFGTIPEGPAVQPLEKNPAVLDADRYVTLEDKIHLPALVIAMPTVYRFHEDEAALDAAAKVMGQGPSSLLYKRLVQSGRAVSASLSHNCSELACTMNAIVVQNPASQETLADMEQAVRATFTEFADSGVSTEALNRYKVEVESDLVFANESVSGKVRRLAAYQTFLDTPNGITIETPRYMSLTPEKVMTAFNQYLADKPAVIISVVPEGKVELAAAKTNFESEQLAPAEVNQGLTERVAIDTFDRSIRPAAPDAKPVKLPTVWEAQLANGVQVIGVKNSETPSSSLYLRFAGGQVNEKASEAGIASFAAQLMNEATSSHTKAEQSQRLDAIGASMSISSGQKTSFASVNVMSKFLDQSIEILTEQLTSPAFSETDINRIRNEVIQGIKQSQKSSPALANDALLQVLGADDNPLANNSAGSIETISKLTKSQLEQFAKELFPTKLATIVVSSSLNRESVLKALTPLGQLENKSDQLAIDHATIAWQQPVKTKVYLVDKPGAKQSSIRVASTGPKWDVDGEYFKAQLMNFNLGGSFNSRINQNLREDKGFTYGARSNYRASEGTGQFIVSTEVKADSTLASIQEIMSELSQYKEQGMTAAEYDFMRSAFSQRDARRYETPRQKLGLLSTMARYDVSPQYLDQRQAAIAQTDITQLNQLAKKLIPLDHLAIVVVGDRADLEPKLDQLGYEIQIIKPRS